MNDKTRQVLIYILSKQRASVTSLMKLAYLSDLVHIKKSGKQITNFSYIRYNFGPFDSTIYDYIKNLTDSDLLKEYSSFTPSGEEFITYELVDDVDVELNNLAEEEKLTIDEVLLQLEGYGAKALTEVAYKTKPMKAIGATLGGNEKLGSKLNLNAK